MPKLVNMLKCAFSSSNFQTCSGRSVLEKEMVTEKMMLAGSARNTFENVLKLGFTTATLLMIYTEILTRDVKAVFQTHKAKFENFSILKKFGNLFYIAF